LDRFFDIVCWICCEDAENFEPRDVKPVPRDHQWDGEDEDQDSAADVRMHFHFCATDAAGCKSCVFQLRSANRHRLILPRCRLNTYGRWAFPVAGPTVWNSPPDELWDPACDVDSFKQFFKTILFSFY